MQVDNIDFLALDVDVGIMQSGLIQTIISVAVGSSDAAAVAQGDNPRQIDVCIKL